MIVTNRRGGVKRMFQSSYPIFLSRQILKAEMLSHMETYPREMFQILFQEYSDGVLFGCHVRVEDMELVVEPGILKWRGNLYQMNEEERVSYRATGTEQYLKVCFFAENRSLDMVNRQTELVLGEEIEERAELELCRFLLKKGAFLRQNYQDFKDCSTIHNTVNLLNRKYAGKGNDTLDLEIMKCFGKELMKYELKNPYDIAFGMLCLQEDRISRVLIENYVEQRLNGTKVEGKTLYQLYLCLNEILEKVKGGTKQVEKRERRKPIFVE